MLESPLAFPCFCFLSCFHGVADEIRLKPRTPNPLCFGPTTRENEVWGAQKYVRECLQEAEVNKVGEEANSHHQHWEAFKHIEACQYTCRKLETYPKVDACFVNISLQRLNRTNKCTSELTQLAHHYHVFYYSAGGYCVFFY